MIHNYLLSASPQWSWQVNMCNMSKSYLCCLPLALTPHTRGNSPAISFTFTPPAAQQGLALRASPCPAYALHFNQLPSSSSLAPPNIPGLLQGPFLHPAPWRMTWQNAEKEWAAQASNQDLYGLFLLNPFIQQTSIICLAALLPKAAWRLSPDAIERKWFYFMFFKWECWDWDDWECWDVCTSTSHWRLLHVVKQLEA